ncbi:MAG TPA: PaaI family thioesterase [Terriglobales bacterium]|jgi:uncharacterized protein (TIGR00369 family)
MGKGFAERDGRHVPSKKNYCFGCGPDNPEGMKLKFSFDEDKVSCRFRLSRRFAGPPDHCHGGIIATLLDEIMAKLNKLHDVTAVTSEMTVRYLRPVPLNQSLRMEARETGTEGRRRLRSAEIKNEKGEVLARAEGLFLMVDPQKVFARNG